MFSNRTTAAVLRTRTTGTLMCTSGVTKHITAEKNVGFRFLVASLTQLWVDQGWMLNYRLIRTSCDFVCLCVQDTVVNTQCGYDIRKNPKVSSSCLSDFRKTLWWWTCCIIDFFFTDSRFSSGQNLHELGLWTETFLRIHGSHSLTHVMLGHWWFSERFLSCSVQSEWGNQIYTKGCIAALEDWLPGNLYTLAIIFIVVSLLQVPFICVHLSKI